jgi:hypothetical protein
MESEGSLPYSQNPATPGRILNQLNTSTSYFFMIHFSIISHPCLGLPSDPFSWGFLWFCMYFLSHMHCTSRPPHPLGLVSVKIFLKGIRAKHGRLLWLWRRWNPVAHFQ